MENQKSILGAIILDNRSYWKAAGSITADHFTTDVNHRIWKAIVRLMDDKDPVDLVSLTTEVGDNAAAYLSTLVDFVPTAANINYYIKQVVSAHKTRQVDDLAMAIVEDTGTADERLGNIESKLIEIRGDSVSDNSKVKDELSGVFKWIENRYRNKGQLIGIDTSLPKLNATMLGFCPGNLVIIGARPSIGKTAFGLQIVRGAGRGLVFSAEMDKQQLIMRMLASESKVDLQGIRSGYIQDADWSKMQDGNAVLHKLECVLNDKSSPHINYIKSVAKIEHMKNPLKYILVDYIGLIKANAESRVQEVSLVSRELKALAKELKVPVIALAQLNRNTEGRTDPTPGLADLKESGSIEQDADDILFLHRPSRYCPACKERNADCKGHPKAIEQGIDDFYSLVKVIVAKQRQGPLTIVNTHFDENRQIFTELHSDMPQPGRLSNVHA